MPVIDTEIWKPNPERPGTVVFDSQRMALEIFTELEKHLEADGRMPDEYFLFDEFDWGRGAPFPRDAEILCNVNYGASEGIYLDITLEYEKDVYEYDSAAGAGGWKKRMVRERFATGKTLGEGICDLDRMYLAASSVTAAFYGSRAAVHERYARVERGDGQRAYPRPDNRSVGAQAIGGCSASPAPDAETDVKETGAKETGAEARDTNKKPSIGERIRAGNEKAQAYMGQKAQAGVQPDMKKTREEK